MAASIPLSTLYSIIKVSSFCSFALVITSYSGQLLNNNDDHGCSESLKESKIVYNTIKVDYSPYNPVDFSEDESDLNLDEKKLERTSLEYLHHHIKVRSASHSGRGGGSGHK